MAKARILFYRSVRFFLKYLFLTLGIILLITWGHGKLGNSAISPVFASTPREELASQASYFTNEGHRLLALGENEEALEKWKQATELYEKLGNEEGIIGSIVNQSIALQALGQYRRACQVLLPALNIDSQDNICDASSEGDKKNPAQSHTLITAIALRTFGDALRNIGNLDKSGEALEMSLEIAQEYKSDVDISAALLSLGNTERGLYKREVDRYNRSNSTNYRNEAQAKAEQALDDYREVSNYSGNKITQIQAKINRLSLLLEFDKWLNEEKPNREAEALVPEIESEITSLPESIITVYTKLNFAEILSLLKKKDEAMQYAKDALQQGQKLNNQRAEAYAIGTIGGLYEGIKNLSEAQKLTEEASKIAKSILAYDITYQWEWQLGRIYRKQGNIEGAIAVYDAAVKDLQIVRQDLLSINIEEQFSFRDNVEPVYREFVDLLLRDNATPEELKKATEVTNSLQLAELENFLQCGYAELKPIDEAEKQPDAIIYPIIREGQDKVTVDVIVKLPHSKQSEKSAPIYRHTTVIDKTEFEKTFKNLQKRLSHKNNDVNELILPPAKKLYDWIVRPAIDELPEKGTLVFVLDSILQGIPMAVLHDGNGYLVEKYSIAVSFGSQFKDAKPLQPRRWNALLAGVSEKADSFSDENLKPLHGVKNELEKIRKIVETEEILNQQFTKEALENQMKATAFPVIHLATHGKFSSNPEETVIYAWDKKIQVKELDSLLRQRGQISENPIELIVLSACETAKEDEKAALGIAGVALKAKSRSVVASLWTIDDNFTASFMPQFYQELNKGMTKAEALQNVQKSFLHNPDYNGYEHPSYWSAFILAGSWL